MTGIVTDPGGEPLVGVSVKAGTTGAITDIDGKYSVDVASNGSITFSYLGFETIMEKVNGRRKINVTLSEKNDVLNEVVVIGYGTMDKKELTSAISRLWVAFPDTLGGAPVDVPFTQNGDEVTFVLPSLKYWTMAVMEGEESRL